MSIERQGTCHEFVIAGDRWDDGWMYEKMGDLLEEVDGVVEETTLVHCVETHRLPDTSARVAHWRIRIWASGVDEAGKR